jgi:hypothetical protein
MTLNLMPLVILFGLALLLVVRTNDQQTQQNAMNMSICVLAIPAFQIADQAFYKPALCDGLSSGAQAAA